MGEDPSSPSQSKEYPNYSITKSSGDSVALGDNSGQWEIEAERILVTHHLKNMEEAANADVMTNNISKEDLCTLGEAATVDVAKLPLAFYENVVFAFKMTMTKTLIEISKNIGVQYRETKKVVWDQII
mgnify:CR=1 FL=1